VLGDDIVIFNASVAKSYFYIMTTLLEVKIGLAKSIVSRKGLTLEFAKKFYIQGERANMVPFRDIIVTDLSTDSMMEFISKHGYSLNSYLKLRGLGYKARGKVNGDLWSLGQRMRLYLVFYHSYKLDWIS